MFAIALTGGIGAGKSVAAEYFASRGAVVIDLDDVATRLLEPWTETCTAVVAEFGNDILGPDGRVDRAKLASVAFADDESAARLNSIVHPAVASEVMPGLTDMGLLQNPPPVVVLVVPLLVEAPVFSEYADVIVTIEAPEDERIARAVDRGMDESDVRLRMERQSTGAERASIADHIIPNVGSEDEFRERLDAFWNEVVTSGA
jgi:dephospho-CoA kinase